MHPDLEALLALQEQDGAIAALEGGLVEVGAQVAALDAECESLTAAEARAREDADAEERKRRDVAGKVQEHRSVEQRNLGALDAVRKAREANAAWAQLDITRRVIAQEESDIQTLSLRINDLRQAAELHRLALDEVKERQAGEREALAARRADIEMRLDAMREARVAAAGRVTRSLLQKYERIRGREKANALYSLRGAACGRCNTAIPLQRRNVMAAGRSIEVCEGCGVLLYATG